MVEHRIAIGCRHATIKSMARSLGELVRDRREAMDMKSYVLAERIGRRPSLISRIENGDYKETPPPDIIAGLSRELDIPQSTLLEACGYDVASAGRYGEATGNPIRDELLDDLSASVAVSDDGVRITYGIDPHQHVIRSGIVRVPKWGKGVRAS